MSSIIRNSSSQERHLPKHLPVMTLGNDENLEIDNISYPELKKQNELQKTEISYLENELEVIRKILSEKEQLFDRLMEEAVKSARESGRQEAITSSENIIKAGVDSLKLGRKAFICSLENIEKLSINIADTVLKTIFEPTENRSEHVASMIKASVSQLEESTVIGARISPQDFGDEEELYSFEKSLEEMGLSFELDPLLQSGECEFDLFIGKMEISMDDHWNEIQRLFEKFFEAEIRSPQNQKVIL